MRRFLFIIAALVIVLILIAVMTACEPQPTSFSAKFDTAADFYDRFDYGYSGLDPSTGASGVPALASFHGDHSPECGGATTSRTVHYTPTFDEIFWWCAPGGADTGHVMTGVDTFGYNIAWFSPRMSFTNVNKVCWNANETQMSGRKWMQVMFVDARLGQDATRYRAGGPTDGSGVARGSGGYDLGFTAPDFRNGVAPSTGIEPHSGTLAGLRLNSGMFKWFQNESTWTGEAGWTAQPITTTDKARRFKHCLIEQSDNTLTIVQETANNGWRVLSLPGQIPDGPVRVVWQDDNYDPQKDGRYVADRLTWHWDNIEIYAG